MPREVSVRELRNHTPDVVRRIEAGECLVLTVNLRPVADIVPHSPRPTWAPSAVVRAIAVETPADRALFDDLADDLDETIDEL